MAALKVAFAGTPAFAAAALATILDAGFEVPLVLTQPDRPSGRGMKLTASPVKQLALAHGIPVDQPERLRNEAQQACLAACAPDVLVVAAYGLILPPAVLVLPRLGCLNIHASLLPRWRGAAPIHRAIAAGDSETGITIMQMDAGLDTGPMLIRQAIPILPDDTTGTLHDRLASLGAEMIVTALAALSAGRLQATPQPEAGVTYANKIDKAEAAVDWRQPAAAIARMVRAFNPSPVATAKFDGKPVKLWRAEVFTASETDAEAANNSVNSGITGINAPGTVLSADGNGVVVACGEGVLRVLELQKPGSRRMPAGEFLRGFPLVAGARFDCHDVSATPPR